MQSDLGKGIVSGTERASKRIVRSEDLDAHLISRRELHDESSSDLQPHFELSPITTAFDEAAGMRERCSLNHSDKSALNAASVNGSSLSWINVNLLDDIWDPVAGGGDGGFAHPIQRGRREPRFWDREHVATADKAEARRPAHADSQAHTPHHGRNGVDILRLRSSSAVSQFSAAPAQQEVESTTMTTPAPPGPLGLQPLPLQTTHQEDHNYTSTSVSQHGAEKGGIPQGRVAGGRRVIAREMTGSDDRGCRGEGLDLHCAAARQDLDMVFFFTPPVVVFE